MQPVNFHISQIRYCIITQNDRSSVGDLATAEIKTNTFYTSCHSKNKHAATNAKEEVFLHANFLCGWTNSSHRRTIQMMYSLSPYLLKVHIFMVE